MLFIWIYPDKTASALILQDRFFNHGVVGALGFRRWPDRKRTSLQVFPVSIITTKAVEFLFDNLGEERTFDYTSVFQVLIIAFSLITVLIPRSEANFFISIIASVLIRCISKSLILYVILHFLVLQAY